MKNIRKKQKFSFIFGFTTIFAVILLILAACDNPIDGTTSSLTVTLTSASITINNDNLTATVNVGGTATGAVTLNTTALPAGVTASVNGTTITVTGVRPTTENGSIDNSYTVVVTRGGVTLNLTVAVNLTTSFNPSAPTVTLTPASVTINDSNLTATVSVSGTATGAVTLNTTTLPAGVSASVSGTTITVTGVPPTTENGSIANSYTVVVTRDGVTQNLTVAVNLTTTWVPPTYYTVRFNPNNFTSVLEVEALSGNTVNFPEEPKHEPYVFGGWFTDRAMTNEFTEATVITGNMTVYARWDIDGSATSKIIISDVLTLAYEQLDLPSQSSRTEFPATVVLGPGGNRDKALEIRILHTVTESITIDRFYLIWRNKDDGVIIGRDIRNVTWIREPQNNNIDTFGWFYPFDNIPGDYELEIYLRYDNDQYSNVIKLPVLTFYEYSSSEEYYTVRFHPNNFTSVLEVEALSGGTVNFPEEPKHEPYVFGGWFTDRAMTNEFTETTVITGNITVYARWDIDDSATSKITIVEVFTLANEQLNEQSPVSRTEFPATVITGDVDENNRSQALEIRLSIDVFEQITIERFYLIWRHNGEGTKNSRHIFDLNTNWGVGVHTLTFGFFVPYDSIPGEYELDVYLQYSNGQFSNVVRLPVLTFY